MLTGRFNLKTAWDKSTDRTNDIGPSKTFGTLFHVTNSVVKGEMVAKWIVDTDASASISATRQ